MKRDMIRQTPQRRRGISLIECMAVFALSAVIGVFSIESLVRLMAAGQRDLQQTADRVIRSQFERQFRGDVHQAEQAEVGMDGTELKLISADGQVIDYRVLDDGMTRTWNKDGGATRYERYSLPESQGEFHRQDNFVKFSYSWKNDPTSGHSNAVGTSEIRAPLRLNFRRFQSRQESN